ELKRKLIDSIVYFQSLRKDGKECAYFEYDNGNSKIATTCINTLKEKDLNREPISIDEVQRLLLEQDIPIEIAKELAIIILKQRFSVDQINLQILSFLTKSNLKISLEK